MIHKQEVGVFEKKNLTVLLPFFLEIGHLLHPCESDLVLKCTNESVPYFNAPIYLENKQQIGKVDEIFGPITEFISFSHCILPQFICHKKNYYLLCSIVFFLLLISTYFLVSRNSRMFCYLKCS